MTHSWYKGPARIALGLVLSAAIAACGGSAPAPKARANVQFSLGAADPHLASALTAAAQAAPDAIPPAAIVVSIENDAGELVYDMMRSDVYAFGPTYVSQHFELEVGHYRLTRFLVVDALNRTVYAAPNAADPGADPALVARVRRPLPIEFDVVPGVVHSQPVEVLPVEEHAPQEFGYSAFTFRINAGPKTSTRAHYGPGPDGVFLTADDEVTGYNYVEFFSDGEVRTDRWYGPDGRGLDQTWFTADDVPMGWWWERNKGVSGANYGGPGADGIWVSDDDTITSWEEFNTRVEADGALLNGLYTDPGPDGLWMTNDDVVGGYLKRFLSPSGAEIRRVRYSSPGWDGIWFTADDEVGVDWFGAYVVNTFPAGNTKWGSWSRQVSYGDPGWDYTWLTPDDLATTCRTHEFADGTEYWTREVVTTPGWDGTCFTSDDSVVGYSVATNTY